MMSFANLERNSDGKEPSIRRASFNRLEKTDRVERLAAAYLVPDSIKGLVEARLVVTSSMCTKVHRILVVNGGSTHHSGLFRQ